MSAKKKPDKSHVKSLQTLPVKLDAEIVKQLKLISFVRNITMSEYLTTILKKPVQSDYLDALKEFNRLALEELDGYIKTKERDLENKSGPA